ncbi:hypothetical protein K439DRAFT_1619991 [Ramaria rubella]|nr:hypothetical protein K439DRAFT_1619991 [Ramaria rubella]
MQKMALLLPQDVTPGAAASWPTAREQLRAELIDKWKGRVQDVQATKKFLETNNMVVVGEPYDIYSLSIALLHIVQSMAMKATLAEGARAVALLITEVAREEDMEDIARHISERMVLPTDQLQSTIEEAKVVAGEIHKATTEMNADTGQNQMNNRTANLGSYAAVVVNGRPTNNHADLTRLAMIAKSGTKARQVLIDEGLDSPAATQLIHDDDDVQGTFQGKFSANALIKPRLYPIIIEWVPLSFKPDDHAHLREMEDANTIVDYEIVKASEKDDERQGHAAWDRACPVFIEQFDKLTNHIPDNHYKYYPIQGDNVSWERHDGTIDTIYTTPPPPANT